MTNELLVGALHERGVRAQFIEPARLSGLAPEGGEGRGRV
jgi:hypothetical protein